MQFFLFRQLAVISLVGFIAQAPFTFAQEIKASEPDPNDVINNFEKISGVHVGMRRNHAKGTCAVGSFQPDAAAKSLSVSGLFIGHAIPVVARFSVAGPNPQIADTTKNPRGMALQFRLPDGQLHQMAMLNTPIFGAATVESFYQRQLADVPDPATGKRDPEKLKAYKLRFSDNDALSDWLAHHNPPRSFAEADYYSLNAFKVIDAAKHERWVKWHFVARDGVHLLSDTEVQTLPNDFLVQRITERMRQGQVQWDMFASLGEAGDPIDNPSIAWPAERQEMKLGTLTLVRAGDDAVGQCEDINFDPNVLSAGIERSPDAILDFRSSAYAVSYGRRSEEKGN